MKLIDKICHLLGATKHKKIATKQLIAFGYFLSKRKISVEKMDTRTAEFIIYEVLDETTKRPASFSYICSTRTNSGYILPEKFEEYTKLL